MIDLSTKCVLVTGATGGIGKEIVTTCLSLGAKVIATGRNIEKLEEIKSNNNLLIIKCDLTNPEEVDHLLIHIDSLDGVVHCAGKIFPYPIKFIKEKHIHEVYSVNTETIITLTSQLFQRKLISKKASLIFMSSISVQHPYMGGSLYVSSKAAIEAFSRSVALEFATDGIRSNCIAPALVQTEIYEQTMNAYTEDQWDKIISQYPLGIGKPKDVANLAVFLLSDLSSWITGNIIPMDGGLLLNSNR
ncbi:MAG TPA: 3-oxoacyl-ACP reductase [Crocinitomicaceae bacterium]|nr:3-oxoacyl-ACP reductase [Crocinitomicaceae bacterium]